MKPQSQHITIAGAGLVGSLLAIYLARRGYEVTIIEKRPDMRLQAMSAGRSINLALANRGMRPLEEVGLLDAVAQLIIPMTGRMLHSELGELTYSAYGQRSHEVIYSVSRGELNKLLMNAAEATGRVKIQFEQAITQIDFAQKTCMLVDERTQAQHAHAFDILIGADGGGSAVRKAFDQANGVASTEEKLLHSYKELHIEAGAIDAQGHGTYRMEKAALHIWPRGDYMLIALPNPDGSFTVTLFLPDTGPDSFAALASQEAFTELFQRRFKDALALMPDAPEQFIRNPTGFLGTVHCPHWTLQDHSLLIGDAAHAIVPFHGQGMNCGFEDCAELARLLDQHDDDWAKVLPAYQAARQPNAEAIAAMALENYVEMRASSADPKFQLKKAVGFALEQRFPAFIPRYSMVMFHHLPYAEAQSRGRSNERILDTLCADIDKVEAVDWARAQQLIAEYLPAPDQH